MHLQARQCANDGHAVYEGSERDLGRAREPEELIGTVVLFCSDAGRFITGADLVISGDFRFSLPAPQTFTVTTGGSRIYCTALGEVTKVRQRG